MLSQASEEGARNLGSGSLGLCPGLDLDSPSLHPIEGRRVLMPHRRCPLTHQPRQFHLHGFGNPVAVAGGKAAQHELVDMDLDGVAIDK